KEPEICPPTQSRGARVAPHGRQSTSNYRTRRPYANAPWRRRRRLGLRMIVAALQPMAAAHDEPNFPSTMADARERELQHDSELFRAYLDVELVDVGYFNKRTDNACDFNMLFGTPIGSCSSNSWEDCRSLMRHRTGARRHHT